MQSPHTPLRFPRASIPRRRNRALWLGLLGAGLGRLVRRRLPPAGGDDLRRHDFGWSTQRMGVRFTERIRDSFRFRWIRKA
jgi:hypothetical protein